MTKKIIYTTILLIISHLFIKAQLKSFMNNGPVNHAQWKLSSKKISDCEYDLIFTVTIDKGWHTFSIVKPKDAGAELFPTEIIFTLDKNYAVIGEMTETKPTPEFDKINKKNVLVHYNKVIFTQRIKLNSAGKINIKGTYENQVCNDNVCNKSPYEDFHFDLQSASVCKK